MRIISINWKILFLQTNSEPKNELILNLLQFQNIVNKTHLQSYMIVNTFTY